ncbi:MAG: ester cyclase [Candidatus Limnocylindrales bacterium]
MTLEQNKAIVRRFVDEIFVGGSEAAVDELLTDDFTPYTWPSAGKGDGKADLKAAIGRTSAALTDVEMTIDDLIAEGDKVAVRLTSKATQVGEFMRMPGSGKSYEIGEIHIFTIRDGKVCEHWHQADFMGMMKQLGATPGAKG